MSLPPGYFLTWGGQFENQQQAMRRLGVIAPAVAGLIFVLLLVTFGSIRAAGLILFNLPFALAGGVFALWVSGLYLSVPASVGFIVLFGVAVLNGVVLISSIAQLRAEGMPAARGGGRRVRVAPAAGPDDGGHRHLQPAADGVRHRARAPRCSARSPSSSSAAC